MTNKPHMTLPNGDFLYEGDYGATRDGQKVGPAEYDKEDGNLSWNLPLPRGQFWFYNDGRSCTGEQANIIAKLVDQDTPKLWQNMTDAEKGALLLAHHEGKELQAYGWVSKRWMEVNNLWVDTCAYRIKPEPKKPREWWIVQNSTFRAYFPNEDEARCTAIDVKGIAEIIHVREVMEDDT